MADINAAKKFQKSHNSNYYKAQVGRTLDNKPKRMRRHLRNHPGDTQAAGLYKERYHKDVPPTLTSKGRKLAARA